MAITKISGNQIATSTAAIIDTLSFLDGESILRLPSGTTDDRPTGVSVGTLRFNTTEDSAEVYKADADGQGNAGWSSVGGGGPAVGNDSIVRTNGHIITEDTSIGSSQGDEFRHGLTIAGGGIEIANTKTVTLESDGYWTIL
tara:strand:+ start:216 stop:641 length:426 start_codon:yes stop_codon:yes gene_type:complete